MSRKINILSLIKKHYGTLINDNTQKRSKLDISTFIIFPILLCLIGIHFDFTINSEFRGALINFGAIFSALLMSVLVLVYEQDNKLTERKRLNDKEKDTDNYTELPNYQDKKDVLTQLYHNICFAIITSLATVVFPLIQIVLESCNYTFLIRWMITPFIIFSLCSMLFTTLMIVKRMHILLNTNLTED